jgi:hypothetical protein
MLKVVFSALAAVVVVTAVGVTAADAKGKAKAKAKAKVETASCIATASGLMRDESKFTMCYPMKR